MPLIVQKYGGTSVGDAERIKKVAQRVVAAVDAGRRVVVVVSAMGQTTDELVDLAAQMSDEPHAREMDMLLTSGERISMALLSMAIMELGREAISFTGSQAGIVTDTSHGKARIVEVRAKRVLEALDDGRVVIVAGFQGVSTDFDVTTLGRGGSRGLYRRSADCARRAQAPRRLVRRDARAVRFRRKGPDAALRRIRS